MPRINNKSNTRPNSKAKKSKNKHARLTHAHEPRSKFIKRILTYSAFALLTLVLTFLVFYRAKGYTFTKSGEVEKRGIVLVDSAPVGAKVSLNGKEVEKTEAKLEVPEGRHTLSIQAEGYRTWQHTFDIASQEVRWFFYPYLIPEVIKEKTIIDGLEPKTYSKLSPEGRVVSSYKKGQGLGQSFTLELLNLREEDPLKITAPLVVPAQIFTRDGTGSLGELSFIEWSPNGDSILLKHQIGQITELVNLRVENPIESLNLNKTITSPISEVHYDARSRLFILTNGQLGLYNPKTLEQELIITEGALSFQNFAEERYVYTKSSPSGLDIYLQESSKPAIKLNSFLGISPSDVDYKYIVNRRTGYLILTNLINKELFIYKNPLDSDPNQEKLPEPFYLSTFNSLITPKIKDSPTGSPQPGTYFALQLSGSEIFVYNLEDEEAMAYNVNKGKIGEQIQIVELGWIDSQRIQVRTPEGNIYYLDFDGNYLNLISNTNKELSYFIKSRSKTILVSSSASGKEMIKEVKFKN